jgi:3-oxoacyl-[acyl-carrier protein] reductase
MPRDLEDKVALVTGGAVGIGRAVALGFAKAGANVAITYHKHDGNEAVVELSKTGVRALAVPVDMTRPTEIDAAVEQVRAQLGAIDVLVTNAGGLIARVPLSTMSVAHWQNVIETNLSSAFYAIRASVAHMCDGGRIVLISSLAAFTGGSGGAGAYAAAKAGMTGLTRALAKELAPRKIAVNAVAPGLILGTPFHQEFTPLADQQAAVARLPVGRAGSPDDVAALVTCLACDTTDFLTGQTITISGGQELT